MSTPSDRLTAVQNTYLDALNNEPEDLAAAQTAADVVAVQTNLANARTAYYTAASAALTNNAASVDAALTAAQNALAAVQAARKDAGAFAAFLTALTGATNAATNLVKLASTVSGAPGANVSGGS